MDLSLAECSACGGPTIFVTLETDALIGKEIRLERIMNRRTNRTVIVPMDHGVSSGPISGIVNMKDAVQRVAQGGASAVILHKGMVAGSHRKNGPDLGLVVHVSGSTRLSDNPNTKALVCSVEEAIRVGADAVSAHLVVGGEGEKEMLSELADISRKASEWGLPLLVMAYPKGARGKEGFDPVVVAHAARLGAELGADLVKVSYTGTRESFQTVVDACPVPVVIAGGPRMDSDKAVLEMAHGAVSAGAAGTSIGRNVFQHSDPARMVAALCMVVHEGASAEQAMNFLGGT